VSTQDGAGSVVHSQGRIYCENGLDRSKTQAEGWIDLASVRRRCLLSTPKEAIYDAFRSGGFTYGPGFQSIEELWTNGAEALAKLKVPEVVKNDFAQFWLHPSLLDGALQTTSIFSLTRDTAKPTIHLPFSLGEVDLLNPLTTECYAYAVP